MSSNLKISKPKLGLFLGIITFLAILFFTDLGPENSNAKLTAAVAALMSIWWIFETIPLAATSLIPLILFPILGILSGKETAQSYMNSTIFLFMGGFIIALAMEKWSVHKRVALFFIDVFGKSPASIIFGFMSAAAFLSLWISNTATVVMILPIGLAILYKMEAEFGKEKIKNFAVSLMLGIAYACSVGGIGTIIGTPPNLAFQRIYSISFPNNGEILFGQWMIFAIPLSLVMLLIIWFLLTKLLYKSEKSLIIDKNIIKDERKNLGRMSFEEKSILIVFTITALLWIFRQELNVGSFSIPGWSNLLPNPNFVDDGVVVIMMALVLFLIPSKTKSSDDEFILDVKVFRKIPWEIILLFGGGFALAEGFIQSGLSSYIGNLLKGLGNIPIIFVIASICFLITFLTELTSNTATAQIVLPILAALAIEINVDPLLLMIPGTISASMAFMMPVATPPNAIVFGSERLKVYQMAKAGIIINLIGVVLITMYAYLILG